ncbi:A24 family peptidase [Insolitispirillum peregrinum]|uniref:Prepilin peptidase CpaA n=1 Tax=Insolitispirillum peregrinum TaxID=80876 RepID=A0A1N7QCE0_9PROT|nr:prepilin peptidase [Insolitispirillum peregrinum]SIT20542.1 prepilin peptidase CpaA [Insolitispirillum peregrinum]
MTAPLSGLVMLLLLWASVRDLLYRKIGNRLVLVLAVLWLGEAGWLAMWDSAIAPQVLHHALLSLPGAAAVLAVGFVLFRLGFVGAGDVKLVAVLCLWVGAPMQSAFLIVTSLAGGLLVLCMPLLRALESWLACLWWSWSQRIPALHGISVPHCLSDSPAPGIPYAPAIALGAAFTLNFPAHS